MGGIYFIQRLKIWSIPGSKERGCKLHTMNERPRIIVVLPAYNAAQTLQKTYEDIPKDFVSNIVLVDDVSQDQTVDVARSLGLSVVIHIQNRGYGGNQKTCYLEALKLGADIVVMLHPDHQYDSRLIPQLVRPIIEGHADMVIGSRILNGMALKGGMPWWKFISNRALTIAENLNFAAAIRSPHLSARNRERRIDTKLAELGLSPFTVNDSYNRIDLNRLSFGNQDLAHNTRGWGGDFQIDLVGGDLE